MRPWTELLEVRLARGYQWLVRTIPGILELQIRVFYHGLRAFEKRKEGSPAEDVVLK
jgi:hypothetical protein